MRLAILSNIAKDAVLGQNEAAETSCICLFIFRLPKKDDFFLSTCRFYLCTGTLYL